MTCSFTVGRTGYMGQKYAVVADSEKGKRSVLGWQNTEDVSGWKKLAKVWKLKNLRVEPAEDALKKKNLNQRLGL